ncbi:MAG: AraC family transcriptional regulator [Acidobacteriaceae bacterium]
MSSARLEMVVKGQRQTALSTPPRLIGPAILGNGLLMEEHDMMSFEMPDHWIPNYLVTIQFLPRPGKRAMFEAGKEREAIMENGCGDVVAPHEVRNFRFQGEARTIILQIEPEVLQSMIESPRGGNAFELIRRWHGPDPVLRTLLMKLRAEIQSGFPAGPLLSEHLCIRLSTELLQRYSIGKLKLDQYKGGLPGTKLKQVIDYIEACLGDTLTTGRISHAVGLSKYHLGKAFNTSTGMTLHSFVLARRMRQSRDLLLNSDLPLAHIADAVGFSSQSHFTTVFLERTGVTPGRFRATRQALAVAFDR